MPALGTLLLRRRLQFANFLRWLAGSLQPDGSLPAAEHAARRRALKRYQEFFALSEHTFNLTVWFNTHYHDRPLLSLSARETATLLLSGRIANAMRRTQEDAFNAYGLDACGHAAALFEFCWIAAYLCGNEEAAKAWLAREYISEGMDVRKAIKSYLARHGVPPAQLAVEYEVYKRLNAFKHASPAWLSFHAPNDWEEIGTLRIGPDPSPHGEWALCLALEAASQSVLLALSEAAAQFLPAPVRMGFMRKIDAADRERLRLHAVMQARWMSSSAAR